ncbi:hypothetical protein [aff. Roholtiella sp. LEGE 12411]|uniref:hypothetical protein n=1 Tax=aff. Roholtiella sp. LEGE 12411 TaxID=1828822 RepID=UPI0030D88F10
MIVAAVINTPALYVVPLAKQNEHTLLNALKNIVNLGKYSPQVIDFYTLAKTVEDM